jgi:MoaA/NifB/PqqE/SkfB family radical SAM enzyme
MLSFQRFILGLFERLSKPSFDWIQVEVTSDCNAACIYCPRTVYRSLWQDRQLSMEAFMKLAPAFKRTRHIHLQGWGEPFLNPHFFEMVAVAKAAGCRVGTTSNANLLDEKLIGQLVESRVDILALSLAGTGEENDRIRKGTSLKKVLEALRTLKEEKKRRNSQTPEIHIAYILLRSGLKGLGGLISLVEGLGVADIVVSTLDFSPSEELQSEVLRADIPEDYAIMRPVLEELAAGGEKEGLRIHFHLPTPGLRRTECTENIGRAVCISSDGAVTPCVYTNLDLSDACHYRAGQSRRYRRLGFGNANERSLNVIWNEPAYKEFRRSFRKKKLSEPCRGCPKLR